MSLNFSIQLKTTRVVTTEQQHIDSVSVTGNVIGFVCINKDDNNSATAFNATGSISEEHCPVCALRTVFAWHTGFTKEEVEVSSDENPASLILSAILSSATKN